MRARLIVNPSSGKDRAADFLSRITDGLRPLVTHLDVTVTGGPDDIVRSARRAVEEQCDALYVAGGDGTVNAAISAVLDGAQAGPTPAIGVIPLGTGNDFAKALGIGDDPEEALAALVQALVLPVDVGMMNDRPFVNISAGGFVADVSNAVTENLKDVAGKLAYVIGGAKAIVSAEPFHVHVSADTIASGGSRYEGELDLLMFAACNASWIGGGYPIAPQARIDDGALELYLVPHMAVVEFLGVLKAIAAGDHGQDARILHLRVSACELRFDRRIRVNVDGELLEGETCRYSVRRHALRFFCGLSPRSEATPAPLMR